MKTIVLREIYVNQLLISYEEAQKKAPKEEPDRQLFFMDKTSRGFELN